jgi:hypothetical protein
MTTAPADGRADGRADLRVDRGAHLRREVGLLRRRETRRVFDTAVYVGSLSGARDSFVARARDLPVLDAALRTDVLCALVERTTDDQRTFWLTRAGGPDAYEQDLAWSAAAHTAFAIHARPLDGCFAVTRYGWRDIVTGESRTWKRLRL